jgi:hypothetical protein
MDLRMVVEHRQPGITSGGDFATAAVPTLPEAPDRFSITTVVLRRC